MKNSVKPNVQNLIPDISIFIIGGLLVYGVVNWGVPAFGKPEITPLGAWMILSVPLVILPIMAGGLFLLRLEKGNEKLTERLRFRRLTKTDWLWCLMGFLGLVIGSVIALKICSILGLDTNPPFARHVEAWTNGRLWLFGVWAIYWPFNILGEDIVWRGIILPRMEAQIGKWAWMFNAVLWGVFHFAFGLGNLIVLLPTLIIVPYIAQQRRNTWTAVLLHASLSAPGFIALAFGMMK